MNKFAYGGVAALAIVVTALIAFYLGTLYVRRVLWNDARSGAIDSYIIFKNVLKKSCYGAKYWAPYPDFRRADMADAWYNYRAARYLSYLCENVSNSNCMDAALPLPSNLDAKAELVLKHPDLVHSIYGYANTDVKNNAVFIVFSGTATAEMWNQDFQAEPVPVPYFANKDIHAHQGFVYVYGGLRDQVRAYLSENVDEDTLVVICGHSLGGAVAQLCALDCYGDRHFGLEPLAHRPAALRVYVFGAPRCGNRQFAAAFEDSAQIGGSAWSVVNTEDLVPVFPTSGTLVEYTHVGAPVAFTANLGNASLNHIDAYITALHLTDAEREDAEREDAERAAQ